MVAPDLAPDLVDLCKVKEFLNLFQALKDAILSKLMINAQTMFKVRFYLEGTPNIDNEKFLITARKAIEALQPLYSFLLE